MNKMEKESEAIISSSVALANQIEEYHKNWEINISDQIIEYLIDRFGSFELIKELKNKMEDEK